MKLLTAALCASTLIAGSSRAYAEEPPLEGCTDTWPKDLKQPALKEVFPTKGTSGHVAFLEVTVSHLPGERVFPGGLTLGGDSVEMGWLKAAQFRVPHPTSAAAPSLAPILKPAATVAAQTVVRLPFIPLPDDAGRVELTLPRLPISISRASGQVHMICTQPHVITVEDPLASTSDQKPKPDPDPRPQIEVWIALRDAIIALLIALPVAAAVVWLFLKLRKKLKKSPKSPPPRPPWQTALATLDAIEARGLLRMNAQEEFLDAVSDTLREYLGDRYGFDGLESTTRETMRQLTSLASDFEDERAVRTILQRADLVKFARRLPSDEECIDALSEIRRIVRATTVAPSPEARQATASSPVAKTSKKTKRRATGRKSP